MKLKEGIDFEQKRVETPKKVPMSMGLKRNHIFLAVKKKKMQ